MKRERTPLTTRRLRRWYRKFNTRYFGNRLPAQIPLRLVADGDHRGFVEGDSIESCELNINREYHWDTGYGRLTLLHEMVHLDLWPYGAHGPRFQKRMQELAKAGAFNGLW